MGRNRIALLGGQQNYLTFKVPVLNGYMKYKPVRKDQQVLITVDTTIGPMKYGTVYRVGGSWFRVSAGGSDYNFSRKTLYGTGKEAVSWEFLGG